MAPPRVGGALHSTPPSDLDVTLLTSTTAAKESFGQHAGGKEDARSESTPTAGMVSMFSFSI